MYIISLYIHIHLQIYYLFLFLQHARTITTEQLIQCQPHIINSLTLDCPWGHEPAVLGGWQRDGSAVDWVGAEVPHQTLRDSKISSWRLGCFEELMPIACNDPFVPWCFFLEVEHISRSSSWKTIVRASKLSSTLRGNDLPNTWTGCLMPATSCNIPQQQC